MKNVSNTRMGGVKLLLLGCVIALGVSQFSKIEEPQLKINGISLVASGTPLLDSAISPIIHVAANHAALMPFGFMKSLDDTMILHNSNRHWYGETVEGILQYGKLLKQNNIALMIKPQIWVSQGEFTGDISMHSEKEWIAFEKQYSAFILTYAQAAADLDAELFCIGTELKVAVNKRPTYWKSLIHEVRKIYKGKITYAANWDSYTTVSFWEDLDYIGVDAYFPLSDRKTPTTEECKLGWQTHKEKLKSLATRENKKILFTEYGYCSTDYAAHEPWNPPRGEVNLEAQTNGLEALHQEFWQEDWFAGGYVWKWFHDHKKSGGHGQSRFTPQNKPAEEILKLSMQKAKQ